MNRSIRFVIVVVVLLLIAGAVFIVLLRELDRAGPQDAVPVLMNPVRDVRVGEWVEYQREGEKVERQEVAEVWPYSYSVKTTATFPQGIEQDYGVGSPRTTWDLGLGQNWRLVSMQPEKITVAGREWDSWRVEHTSRLIGLVVSWISDEVPLGLLRRQLIRPDQAREPEPGDGLRPLAPETIEYNYVYLRHGYTDPAAGSEPEGD